MEAVKFGAWTIPRANRLDPNNFTLRSASHAGFRMDGDMPAHGSGRKPVEAKIHPVAFTLKESCESNLRTAVNRMMQALLAGQQQLWFDTLSRSGPRLYSVASLSDIEMAPDPGNWSAQNVRIDFEINNPIRYRPLSSTYLTANGFTPVEVPLAEFGESELLFYNRVFHREVVSSSPHDFTITNDVDSQIRTKHLIIRLEALGAGGWVNPKVENLTTGQYFQFASTAVSAAHVIQINCALGAPAGARESTNNGVSFVNTPEAGNVWPDITVDDKQNPTMEFIPGNNDIRITNGGSPNLHAMFLWRPGYGL